MALQNYHKIQIPVNMFSVFDEVLFKVLLLLYVMGRCNSETEEEEIPEDEDCYTDVEVSYLAKMLNLEHDVVVDAIARLIEEGYVNIRVTEETEELKDLISYWVDYQEIEALDEVPEDIALYDDSFKINLYPEDKGNVTDYLIQFQGEY